MACSQAMAAVQSPEDLVAPLVRMAAERRLADERHWLRLLHFPVSDRGAAGAEGSDVLTPDFFLDPRGGADPVAELNATLRAFLEPVGQDANAHARCRYPARYEWLKARLGWGGVDIPVERCVQYRDWTLHGEVQSISLVFASGYLSNPASLFGHLLVKFNARGSERTGRLLDPSMSYGAVVPPRENGAVFAIKAIIGGYHAGFSHDRFFLQNHNYTETELRDLWDYELDLTPAERDELVAHSWEMLRVRFRYRFLTDNCASRVADLFGTVLDERFLPEVFWAIPAGVVDRTAAIRRGDRPLVARVTYLPSRQNRLYRKYEALRPDLREAVRAVAEDSPAMGPRLSALSDADDRIRVVETLFDYYEYRAADAMEAARYAEDKRRLLVERARLPAKALDWPDRPAEPPHERQPPMLVQLSAERTSAFGNGIELRVRPAYDDVLAPDRGRTPYTGLAMFDLRLAVGADAVRFRSLHLLRIEQMNLARTDLPGDGGAAWRVLAGVEQEDLRCDTCAQGFIEGGTGKALRVGALGIAYGMFEGRAQSPDAGGTRLAGTGRIGAVVDLVAGWRSAVSLARRFDIDGERSRRTLANWENRIGAQPGWDVRFGVERNGANRAYLAWGTYW